MKTKNRVKYADISKKQQLCFIKLTNREQMKVREMAIAAYHPSEITVVPYEYVRIKAEKD